MLDENIVRRFICTNSANGNDWRNPDAFAMASRGMPLVSATTYFDHSCFASDDRRWIIPLESSTPFWQKVHYFINTTSPSFHSLERYWGYGRVNIHKVTMMLYQIYQTQERRWRRCELIFPTLRFFLPVICLWEKIAQLTTDDKTISYVSCCLLCTRREW